MARNQQILISGKTILYIVIGFLSLTLPLLLLTDFYFIPFALVFGVAFMILIFYSPFIGLLIYTVFFLLRPQEWIGILEAVPMPMERPLALLLLVSVLFRNILRGEAKFHLRSVDSSLLIYIGVVFLSVVFAIRVEESWTEWQDLAKLALLHFVMAAVIQNKQELRLYLLYVVGLTAFYSFWSVWGYYTGMRQYRMGIWRAIGPDISYGAPNSLAITLVSTFPLIYYHLRKDLSHYVRLGLYGVMAIMLWNVVLTGSRTGMVGMLFFFMLLMWQGEHRVRNFFITAVALACLWFVMPDQYKARFESTTEISPIEDDRTGASMSASARIEGVKIGLQMVADRPFFGYGIGNWGFASGSFYRPGWWGNAHTIIGQIIGEIGLVGTAVFILWLVVLFRAIGQLRRYYLERDDEFMANTALALRTMLILLLVLGLGGHLLFRYSWFLVSAMTAAMLKVMEQEQREESASIMIEPATESSARTV